MAARSRLRRSVPFGVLLLALSACVPLSPLYSATAYEQATSLKAQASAVMRQATEPFGDHEDRVDALRLELAKAVEFARGRPRNDIIVRQWEILMSPDTGLLEAFLLDWEAQGTLRPAFVEEKVLQVQSGFDAIIGLESGLIDPSDL